MVLLLLMVDGFFSLSYYLRMKIATSLKYLIRRVFPLFSYKIRAIDKATEYSLQLVKHL